MTINQIISQIRETVKSRSDDSDYSDEYFYELIKTYRALLLRQRAEKHRGLSQFNNQKFCVELKCASNGGCIDCDKDINCNVLRSIKKLPSTIHGRNNDLLKVRTVAGMQLSKVSDYSEYKSLAFTKTRRDKLVYTISNGYLEVYGSELLKYLWVDAPLEDPTALVDWNTCGSDNTESCYDILSDEFPMEESLIPTLKEMIYKELGISRQMVEDERNDSRADQNSI